jgi:hypothetical protein
MALHDEPTTLREYTTSWGRGGGKGNTKELHVMVRVQTTTKYNEEEDPDDDDEDLVGSIYPAIFLLDGTKVFPTTAHSLLLDEA